MKVLEIKDLKFGYKDSLILDGINLTVDEGDFLAISGVNGSGKSTLLKLILKDLKKDGGEIKIFNTPIDIFDNYDKIGYVPQINETNKIAFPVTSREYVMLNLYDQFNSFNRPSKTSLKKVDDVFTTLDIEELEKRPVNELSGGQAQRVMIARAMVKSPSVLILDEPTVGIDRVNKEKFMDLLGHLNQSLGITIIMISHEKDIVEKYASRVVEIKEGKIYA